MLRRTGRHIPHVQKRALCFTQSNGGKRGQRGTGQVSGPVLRERPDTAGKLKLRREGPENMRAILTATEILLEETQGGT